MNNIDLKVRGLPKNSFIFLDDKIIKPKKNAFSSRVFVGQTEKQKISLKIYKVQDLSLKNWWLYEICYFILSIFGLFDYRGKGTFIELSYEATLNLAPDTQIELMFDRKSEAGLVVKNSNIEIEEKENTKQVNMVAKKRFKWVVFAKILAWIVLAVVICLCAFL